MVSLFLARFALGFGEGATFPTATRAMQSWVAKDQRGFAQGITHSFARFGNAITPPLVVVLMGFVGWRGPSSSWASSASSGSWSGSPITGTIRARIRA